MVTTTGTPPEKERDVAEVDFLVDENGSPIEVPHDSELKITTDVEQTVGATGPTNWWRMGLLALAIVLVILGVLQMLQGGASTAVQPGTPVSAPAPTSPAPPAN
ncbi:MAG TPA: hypothetical protein VGM83_10275 [Devosiaceae bacterium]|jgi:hypothetical protein